MNGRGTSYRTGWSDWRDQAECRNYDSELFFPVGAGQLAHMQTREAKGVCAICPVRQQCLEWALNTTGINHGIFGGLDEEERSRLQRRRKWAEKKRSAG